MEIQYSDIALFGAAAAAAVAGTSCLTMGIRLLLADRHESFSYNENMARVDPNASLLDRLNGTGYRPLHPNDTRVKPILSIKKDKTGKRRFTTKYTLTKQSLHDVLGSKI